MDPAEVAWQPVLGGPLPLSLPASALAGRGDQPGEEQPGEGQLASELRQSLLQGPVRALTEVTAAMSVSPIVLHGNIASAVNAAAAMIAAARPGLATRAAAVRRALLSAPGAGRNLDQQRGGVPQAKLLPDLPGLPGGHLGGLRGLRPQRDLSCVPARLADAGRPGSAVAGTTRQVAGGWCLTPCSCRPYGDAAAVKDRGGAVSAKSGEIPALSRNGGPLRGRARSPVLCRRHSPRRKGGS